jgi:hypothetical protein
MKSTKYIFIFLLVSLCFSACKKDFLDTFPTTSVGADNALSSTQNAYAALNGIHRIMYTQYDAQGQSGEGGNNLFRDYMGEDIVFPLAGGSQAYVGFMQWVTHRNVNDGSLRYMYRFYYRLISNANILINGIDKVPGGAETDRKIIKGQALAYRAWAHFQLVQLWGKRYDAAAKPNSQLGVPLLVLNTLDGQSRATVEDVYTQINKDLDDAIALLTGYNRGGSAAKSNINVNVAQGFKARVALTQQNWTAASTAAIAARQGIALMDTTTYVAGFNTVNNNEWIWGSRQIDDHNTFFFSYFAYISANFNSTVLRTQPRAINATLWEAISASDVRKKCWDKTGASVPVPPGGAKVAYQNKKFLAQSSSSSVGDIPMMRAAEMYLMEAEAKARSGDDPGAQAALFTLLKARDRKAVLPTETGQALIDRILFNRRIELWGEGFRFTDLKRLNLPLNRNGIPNHITAIVAVRDIPAGSVLWEWFFPQDELNTNKLIVQNPL